MVRRASEKSRLVVQQQVKKLRCNKKGVISSVGSGEETTSTAVDAKGRGQDLAQICFQKMVNISATLGFISYFITSSGDVRLVSRFRRIFHYLVEIVFIFAMFVKLCGSFYVIYNETRPGVDSFVSISVFLVCFDGWCTGMSVVFLPEDTTNLINNWPVILKSISSQQTSPFRNLSASLMVISVTFLCNEVVITMTFMGFVYGHLPVTMHPILMHYGIIPDSTLLWRMVCLPFDLFINYIAMYQGCIGAITLFVGVGVQKECISEIQ